MSRWWISWEEPGDDYRPNGQYPLPESIKAYWCSGSGEGYATLCAVVDAETSEAAWKEVEKSWPDRGAGRFCEARDDDWRPGSRFPWPDNE